MDLDSVDCGQCDVYFWKGPALWLGLSPIQSGFEGPVSTANVALSTSADPYGPWEGFNLYCPSGQSCSDAAPNLHGNFGVRSVFRPLCPQRIGDINDDCRIDAADVALVQACWQGPGMDVFDTTCRYCDLDNDNDVDNDDLAIVSQRFTGAAPVQCPVVDLGLASISRAGTTGTDLSDDLFTIQNIGCGDLQYTFTSSTPWLSVTPEQGSSEGEVDTITIHYGTRNLRGGTYTADLTVSSPDGQHSPQTINVTVLLKTPGDFDGDNNVDSDDYDVFVSCAGGPAIPYAPSCTLTADSQGFVAADFDTDRDVDMDDFGVLQSHYDGGTWGSMNRSESQKPSACSSGLKPLPRGQANLPSLAALPLPSKGTARLGAALPDRGPHPDSILVQQLLVGAIWADIAFIVLSIPYNMITDYMWQLKVSTFIYNGTHGGIWADDRRYNEIQADIRAALQDLRGTGNALAVECADWYNFNHWDTDGVHLIAINTSAPDTELIPTAATAPKLSTTVVLHQAYVTRGRAKRNQWGTRGIALLLFCEWMHQRDQWKSATEETLQSNLKTWRTAVDWGSIAPEIRHGETEGAKY